MLEKDVQKIAAALEEVVEWETLAGWLNINSHIIKSNCAYSTDEWAQCYRRKLVETYCKQQSSDDPRVVAIKLADKLEEDMGLKRQADRFRSLFGKLCSN